ncbi:MULTISPECIES: protein-export chaperone SecB [Bacillus subtilis group]|nr:MULTISPECIES: protein-export chaperone SecB [Bacillus subtilis group]MCM3352579.1 protein-export chaperone SecB [Bacillus halotolerans]MCY8424196.1 protein-export chaperone SecB [Bacillus vallismortis]QVN28834.1 protein-export chaperone SecB [Bacillus halotolerans]
MKMLDYYRLIRNSVQLQDVKLKSVKCEILDENSKRRNLSLSIERDVKLLSDTKALILMNAKVHFKEEGPFFIEITYEGKTELLDESIDKEEFEEYNYHSVVPLLLPYARECVANLLSRMNFPIYTIPTVDVLETMKQNMEKSKEE